MKRALDILSNELLIFFEVMVVGIYPLLLVVMPTRLFHSYFSVIQRVHGAKNFSVTIDCIVTKSTISASCCPVLNSISKKDWNFFSKALKIHDVILKYLIIYQMEFSTISGHSCHSFCSFDAILQRSVIQS